MSEYQIPEAVAELLQPVNIQPPTGEDIARSDDPVASAAYTDLEMEITKVGTVDYQKTAQMAGEILVGYSKHLRVASWLCLSWYRLEGLTGLKNGLILILQLLKTFSGQLHPEKAAHRSKAIQFISTDKRFLTIEISDSTDQNLVAEIQDLLNDIRLASEKLLPENAPDLSQIEDIIRNRQGAAKTQVPDSGKPVSGQMEENREQAQISDSGKVEKTKEPDPHEGINNSNAGAEEVSPSDTKIEITAEVLELLEDISPDQPVGENIEETHDQDAQVMYMTLESEISRYSGNDYPKCFKLAQRVLRENSKHLRVAVWILIAWFRIEDLDGFKNGLQLLLELIKKYGSELYPADNKQKSRILQLLNTEARVKLIDKVRITPQNAPVLKDIGKLFLEFAGQSAVLLADAPPKLSSINEIITQKVTEANEILNGKKKEIPQRQTQAVQSPSVSSHSRPNPPPVSTAPQSSTGSLSVADDKSARIAIKKALQFYFQDDSTDPPKKKLTEDPMVYSVSRALRWSKIKQPPDNECVTQIEGPNEPKQAHILKLYQNKDWDSLIPELETNFITNDSFTFWLDSQRILIDAMEQKGNEFDQAAEEIKVHVARLVTKYPDITKLIFKDGKTAFADKNTVDWIQNDLTGSVAGGKADEKILPPIMGEDYAQINAEYESVCQELPKNFEGNLKKLQQSIEAETRKKGRFLRLLNLGNYCYLAKKYTLAQPFFKQLMQLIEEYHISEWETALCVAVWQSSYLNNHKLFAGEKDKQKKLIIEQDQKTLFEKIVKYDAVLALTLENQIQK